MEGEEKWQVSTHLLVKLPLISVIQCVLNP